MPRGHPDIHYREFRPQLINQFKQPRSVVGLADHLEPSALKEAGQTLAQQDIVVRKHHPGLTRIHITIIGPHLAVRKR